MRVELFEVVGLDSMKDLLLELPPLLLLTIFQLKVDLINTEVIEKHEVEKHLKFVVAQVNSIFGHFLFRVSVIPTFSLLYPCSF